MYLEHFFFLNVGCKAAYPEVCSLTGGFLREAFPKANICPHWATLLLLLTSLCVALSTSLKGLLVFLLPVSFCWNIRPMSVGTFVYHMQSHVASTEHAGMYGVGITQKLLE